MCRKAQGLLGQSATLQFTSGMLTEVSKQMAAEPGEHVTEINRFGDVVDEYDTDNTGPAMLGMLLAVTAQAHSQQAKADADTIVKRRSRSCPPPGPPSPIAWPKRMPRQRTPSPNPQVRKVRKVKRGQK